MGPGSHAGAGYSEGEDAASTVGRGLLTRLWQVVRPPLPEPVHMPQPRPRRTSLAHLRADDVRNVRFSSTKFREGYNQDDVDDFLDRVEAHLRGTTSSAEPLTAEDVVNQRFRGTKFQSGYDQDEVDDFLDRIVTELRRQQWT